jgi:hypothetical protein
MRAMQARTYVFAHTFDLADPAAPIWTDGVLHEVAPGVRLFHVDGTCETCRPTVSIDLGDDSTGLPNVLILDHEERCAWLLSTLAKAERKPELDKLKSFITGSVTA